MAGQELLARVRRGEEKRAASRGGAYSKNIDGKRGVWFKGWQVGAQDIYEASKAFFDI